MTLFVRTSRRLLEISDVYLMAVSFVIFFAVGRVLKAVIEKLIEKQKQNNTKNINVANPTGGNLGIELTDDTELAHTILTCIADDERYLVKDPELVKIIFGLVKAKIKNESLTLTPNMMRFLALKLISNDQPFVVKIGNIVASSNNRARLVSRTMGAAVIGFVGAFFATIPYCILILLLYFSATENCGYKCSDYFEQLPKEGPAKIYVKEPTGQLFIGENDDARQLEIYIPSKTANEVSINSKGELKTTKTYSKIRKKAKLVKFSDFKQTDPVLSRFHNQNLQEPEIPQKICPIDNVHDIVHDIIDIRAEEL